MLEIRFTQAGKHRIGRAPVRYVMTTVTTAGTVTAQGNPAWIYTGPDERGRELEVIAVEIGQQAGAEPFLLVINAMPASFRERDRDA